MASLPLQPGFRGERVLGGLRGSERQERGGMLAEPQKMNLHQTGGQTRVVERLCAWPWPQEVRLGR